MDAERIVDSLLEAWTKEDWSWAYDQAERVFRILYEIYDQVRSNELAADEAIKVANERLSTEPVPIQFVNNYEKFRGRTGSQGFYSGKTRSIFLSSDLFKLPASQRLFGIIVHELVHYLQHKKAGFTRKGSRRPPYMERPEEMVAYVAGEIAHQGAHLGTDLIRRLVRHEKDRIKGKVKNRWLSTVARHGSTLADVDRERFNPRPDRSVSFIDRVWKPTTTEP